MPQNELAPRRDRYNKLAKDVAAVIDAESDLTANLSNVSALIFEAFDFLWVGFYRVTGEELVLGPFQGPMACTRIARGRGVCGTAWTRNEILIVPELADFVGHISCNPASKSEIVLPVVDGNAEVFLVLDIDSKRSDDFGPEDKKGLSAIVRMIEQKHG